MTSPFKGRNGSWLTKSLFKDLDWVSNPSGLFTVAELKQMYLETEDPTEYIFAETHLGGWSHWQTILKSSQIRAHIELWRGELDARLHGKAVERIRKIAEAGGKDAFAANKYLLEGRYKQNETPRGRPSKAEVGRKAQQIAEEASRVTEDFQRMFSEDDSLN